MNIQCMCCKPQNIQLEHIGNTTLHTLFRQWKQHQIKKIKQIYLASAGNRCQTAQDVKASDDA